jgi:dienelactone hydrolase
MRRFKPVLEQCESRISATMVFIFSGNALAAAAPGLDSQLAADQLLQHGDQPVQVSTPALNSPSAFSRIASFVRTVSRGQPIGLVGFSAGGAIAMRLAGQPGLNVTAVMNYYGPPDLRDWLAYHRGDSYYHYVASHVHLTRGVVSLLSGVSHAKSYFVNAFGLHDGNVVAWVSAQSFSRDFPQGQVYYYPGTHGVTLYACYPAFQDFLSHL